MSQKFDFDRRRFLATASRVMLAAPFGLAGPAWAKPDDAPLATFETVLSALDKAPTWVNSSPLKANDLRGKIVLIDFWTYTCINWRRTLPYLREWAAKYKDQGFVVIGVHTPEFSFEHKPGECESFCKRNEHQLSCGPG